MVSRCVNMKMGSMKNTKYGLETIFGVFLEGVFRFGYDKCCQESYPWPIIILTMLMSPDKTHFLCG